MIVELAAQPGLRAVLATAAHQFPGGAVLAPDRRAALLQWAHEVDGVVLEDGYDAEFRYDRKPVGTVQGKDPSRVVLFKSLASRWRRRSASAGWSRRRSQPQMITFSRRLGTSPALQAWRSTDSPA